MVVDDADETSAGIDNGQLCALVVNEVCHHVGDFWYQIGGRRVL
jgi:hypothetical protein